MDGSDQHAQYGCKVSPIVKQGYILGSTFSVRHVTYAAVDELAIFEGDIILGSVKDLERTRSAVDSRKSVRPPSDGLLYMAMTRRLAPMDVERDPDTQEGVQAGAAIKGFRWPNGLIPYTIAPTLAQLQIVNDAIAHWQTHTPIRFVARTAENAQIYPDYISFENRDGCWSFVGMRGGEQVISLSETCSTGNAIHEIGHAVGLWHEQSRSDRDRFVDIIWPNIQEDALHNFLQHITGGDDVGDYDYHSSCTIQL